MVSPRFRGESPPPPGLTPNLINPGDAGRIAILSCYITFNAIITILFGIRAYTKLFIIRRILIEDVSCAIAWALISLYSVTIYIMVHYGLGFHSWDIAPANYSMMLKWLYVGSIIYCPAAFFTRATLLLLIARVFSIFERLAKGIYIFIAAIFVAYIPIQVLKTIVCSPIRAYWDPAVQGTCLDQPKIFLADLALALFTDLVILTLPIPLTWSLNLPLRKKAKVIVLLGAGGLATASTAFRIYKAVQFQHSTDVAGDFEWLGILTIFELSIGFICACLPTMMIFLEKVTKTVNKTALNTPRPVRRFAQSTLWRTSVNVETACEVHQTAPHAPASFANDRGHDVAIHVTSTTESSNANTKIYGSQTSIRLDLGAPNEEYTSQKSICEDGDYVDLPSTH